MARGDKGLLAKLSANDIAHASISEKLDRLIVTTDKMAEAVQKHAEVLAVQEATLADHVRRTHLLEIEVNRLDSFRTKVTAISAFVLAVSGLVIAISRIWF